MIIAKVLPQLRDRPLASRWKVFPRSRDRHEQRQKKLPLSSAEGSRWAGLFVSTGSSDILVEYVWDS